MTDAPEKLKALPIWQGTVTAKPLPGGRSNQAYIATDDKASYVVRFCSDIPVHHVMRDHEAMASKAAAKAGFAPDLVYYDHGTMVFKFITARTYSKTDVQQNLVKLANRIKDFHHQVALQASGPARLFCPFYVIRDYTRTLIAGKSRYLDILEQYNALADQLEQAQVPQFNVFAHNDFIPENILDDGKKIWIIDFEYAAFSTPIFDLANLASLADFTPEQDEELLATYFDTAATPQLIKAHAAMKVASLIRETMWSMVSEIHLDAPGVDYIAYVEECQAALQPELAQYQSRFGKLEQAK